MWFTSARASISSQTWKPFRHNPALFVRRSQRAKLRNTDANYAGVLLRRTAHVPRRYAADRHFYLHLFASGRARSCFARCPALQPAGMQITKTVIAEINPNMPHLLEELHSCFTEIDGASCAHGSRCPKTAGHRREEDRAIGEYVADLFGTATACWHSTG